MNNDDRVRWWLGGEEFGWIQDGAEILSQPYEGYTPDEHARIINMWNEYSDRIHECTKRCIADASARTNGEFSPNCRRFVETLFAFNIAVVEKHYKRIGTQNTNRITLPPILSLSEFVTYNNIVSSPIPNIFNNLQAQTNYQYTGVMSWNAMYFALDVIFGRRLIVEKLCY